MSDTAETPDSAEYARRLALYRAASLDPVWARGEILTEAMGTLRALASANHGDTAQDRAKEAVERIDAAVTEKLREARDAKR